MGSVNFTSPSARRLLGAAAASLLLSFSPEPFTAVAGAAGGGYVGPPANYAGNPVQNAQVDAAGEPVADLAQQGVYPVHEQRGAPVGNAPPDMLVRQPLSRGGKAGGHKGMRRMGKFFLLLIGGVATVTAAAGMVRLGLSLQYEFIRDTSRRMRDAKLLLHASEELVEAVDTPAAIELLEALRPKVAEVARLRTELAEKIDEVSYTAYPVGVFTATGVARKGEEAVKAVVEDVSKLHGLGQEESKALAAKVTLRKETVKLSEQQAILGMFMPAGLVAAVVTSVESEQQYVASMCEKVAAVLGEAARRPSFENEADGPLVQAVAQDIRCLRELVQLLEGGERLRADILQATREMLQRRMQAGVDRVHMENSNVRAAMQAFHLGQPESDVSDILQAKAADLGRVQELITSSLDPKYRAVLKEELSLEEVIEGSKDIGILWEEIAALLTPLRKTPVPESTDLAAAKQAVSVLVEHILARANEVASEAVQDLVNLPADAPLFQLAPAVAPQVRRQARNSAEGAAEHRDEATHAAQAFGKQEDKNAAFAALVDFFDHLDDAEVSRRAVHTAEESLLLLTLLARDVASNLRVAKSLFFANFHSDDELKQFVKTQEARIEAEFEGLKQTESIERVAQAAAVIRNATLELVLASHNSILEDIVKEHKLARSNRWREAKKDQDRT
ncbi:hypothetical protein Efla_001677 [Eimeria flavescens]